MWVYVIPHTFCESAAVEEMAHVALIIIYILLKKIDRNVNVFFYTGHFRNWVNCLSTCQYQFFKERILLFNEETFQKLS